MEKLLDNLDKLAQREVQALTKICGVDSIDLAEMIAEIKKLNPKPALAFDHSSASAVIPDILMRATNDGGWHVELNPDTLPKVLLNQNYHAKISSNARSKQEKDYISEQFNSASWLVKALHQRATTIMKVATELVKQQEPFFRYGIQSLKPLTLKDIADAIEMHESTVSRVTTNKYMLTPRGIFELKYFFTTALASSDGGIAHSSEAVRHRIKDLIENEKPKEVLSDDRLVELLKADGIDVARRTVAKYRESLKIPSSFQRKREKALK
jgi:RNA polymerase sigma-54 factor